MTTLTLFIGAFLDALIGPNLVIPGEPFLLAAGYQLHQGIYIGVISVLLGGFIGDQSSYFIGRRYGHTSSKKLIKWQPKLRRVMARCRLLMTKKGPYVLVLARLLGPVAWVVPYMAGSHHIAWRKFTFYSVIGLLLGVGQFVIWGYLLSYGLDNFPLLISTKAFIIDHQDSVMVFSAACLLCYIGLKVFRYKYP